MPRADLSGSSAPLRGNLRQISEAQADALERGRRMAHELHRSVGPRNIHIATRVFRAAVEAIERDGSCRQYFEELSVAEPKAFLAFLGKCVSKLIPTDGSDLEAEGERVFTDMEEVARELERRGLPLPFDDALAVRERETLLSQVQVLSAKLRDAERTAEDMQTLKDAAVRGKQEAERRVEATLNEVLLSASATPAAPQ